MNRLKVFLVFFAGIIIQTAVIPNFSIFGSYANMTLAMTVALAMNFGSYIAGYSGMALGLLEDLLFSQTMGVKALIYFIIGFIVGYNEDSINKGDVRSGCIITILATLFYWGLNTVIYMFIGNGIVITNYIKGPIFIELFLNVMLYIICHYTFKKVFKKKKFRF
ncbi:MAG: rod shape-determining protein MreD [Peptoniphilaceae bacterium]|uniref:rod shape-determining protein MreD n=1 Tax=Parvimonas sp. TaxID=1944660 RepID=UPI0025CD0C6E|nr:rod shape-determining protein MreD [Parvimonas sp.]MCI5997758.1 rod shape-determining protein MreD [Parvimonas sp.]MDD7765317.1 rod shape-determining protein MreD [Peptoniphilaceae bacterium]MDY3050929.1 rod shape-determining protein MreD [Parvimonas sp.]